MKYFFPSDMFFTESCKEKGSPGFIRVIFLIVRINMCYSEESGRVRMWWENKITKEYVVKFLVL